METNTTASRKLIAKWGRTYKAGIYDNCSATIRLYADRAIYKHDGVRWQGNTGGYHTWTTRIVGKVHEDLLALAAAQDADGEDYTEDAMGIASRYVGEY